MGSCIDDSYNTEYLNHALSCVTCWGWWNETQSIQSNEKNEDESMTESLDLSPPAPLSLSYRSSTGKEFDFELHVDTISSSSSKEYLTSSVEVSEEVRDEEVEVGDCNSLAESRDGISECNSHSTISTRNQILSTVTLDVCDSIPAPCQHSCVNDKVLNQSHDSGKTFCDSSAKNESRTLSILVDLLR